MKPVFLNTSKTILYIMYILIFVFLIQNIVSQNILNNILNMAVFIPARYSLNGIYEIDIIPTIISPITYAFLHSDINHLISNIIFYLPFASVISKKNGDLSFTLVFFGRIIFSAFAYWFTNPLSIAYLIGASGGVSGLAGFIASKSLLGQNFPPPFNNTKNTVIFVIIVLILNVIIPFLFIENVAWEAHLAGFAFGFLIAPILKKEMS